MIKKATGLARYPSKPKYVWFDYFLFQNEVKMHRDELPHWQFTFSSEILKVLQGDSLRALLRQHNPTWEEVLRQEKLETAAGISSSFPKRTVTELPEKAPGPWSSETLNRCCFPQQISSRPSSHLPYCDHLDCFILLQNSRCLST